MQLLPKARSADIIVQEIGKEVMIYDTRTDRAACLNETCALVYNFCDGRRTFEDLKRRHRLTDDIIHFALGELRRHDLIEAGESNYFGNLSRREVIRRVGLSAMVAIPAVSSLAAPPAAHAASGLRANGQSCTNASQCVNNACQRGVCCRSNDFGVCSIGADCCSGVACTSGVCCQGAGRTCDTRSPNQCCPGLTCTAPAGQTNGSCQ